MSGIGVFPARAGVILICLFCYGHEKSLSRTSGGDPSPSEVIPLVCKSFPHERG